MKIATSSLDWIKRYQANTRTEHVNPVAPGPRSRFASGAVSVSFSKEALETTVHSASSISRQNADQFIDENKLAKDPQTSFMESFNANWHKMFGEPLDVESLMKPLPKAQQNQLEILQMQIENILEQAKGRLLTERETKKLKDLEAKFNAVANPGQAYAGLTPSKLEKLELQIQNLKQSRSIDISI